MANTIIMASGLGTRMRPLTKVMPKPLIKVLGKPMIESVIEALQIGNVEKIYVVVGYLKEQFKYLCEKYRNVQLIENPDFEIANNISSIYYARNVLEKGNTFICEADLVVSNNRLFCVELPTSCYFGKFIKGYSGDWVFNTNEYGRITRVGKGGTDVYNMVGISFFTASDALILRDKIEAAYGCDGYEKLFWDDVVNDNLAALNLRIHPVADKDICEIDTVEELNVINGRGV